MNLSQLSVQVIIYSCVRALYVWCQLRIYELQHVRYKFLRILATTPTVRICMFVLN